MLHCTEPTLTSHVHHKIASYMYTYTYTKVGDVIGDVALACSEHSEVSGVVDADEVLVLQIGK